MNGSNGSRPIPSSGRRLIPAGPPGGMMVTPSRTDPFRSAPSARSVLGSCRSLTALLLSRSRNQFTRAASVHADRGIRCQSLDGRSSPATLDRELMSFKDNVILFMRMGHRLPAYCLYALCYQMMPAVVSFVASSVDPHVSPTSDECSAAVVSATGRRRPRSTSITRFCRSLGLTPDRREACARVAGFAARSF